MPKSSLPFERRTAQRAVAVSISAALHLAVLLALIWLTLAPPVARRQSVLSVLDLTGQAQAAQAPVTTAAVKIPLTSPRRSPLPAAVPDAATSVQAAAAEGISCPIASDLQAALLADPAAVAELAAIPETDLSVAGAIVLWPGTPEQARPVLPAVDAVILSRTSAASPDCLEAPQTGPDFLFLPLGQRTISIAIGSGQWRWKLILDELLMNMHPTEPLERISPQA